MIDLIPIFDIPLLEILNLLDVCALISADATGLVHGSVQARLVNHIVWTHLLLIDTTCQSALAGHNKWCITVVAGDTADLVVILVKDGGVPCPGALALGGGARAVMLIYVG